MELERLKGELYASLAAELDNGAEVEPGPLCIRVIRKVRVVMAG